MTRRLTARVHPAAVMGLAAAVALALSACKSTPEPMEKPPVQPTGSEWDQGNASDTTKPKPMMDDMGADLDTVYFDYDRSEIRTDAKPILRGNAEMLRNHRGAPVTIEGHCDERGSDEYNLALGDRRAKAVKRYLVSLGVDESRMRTVSFGESRPAAYGHNEEAWARNRRAEFRLGG